MHKRTSLFLSLVMLTLAPQAHAADVSAQLDAGDGFVVKNSTGTIERQRIDEATGNVSRNGMLFVHTTGPFNTFVGTQAGNTTITGYDNTAFGYAALHHGSTGHSNTAVGSRALFYNATGHDNSAFGSYAMFRNTTGYWNTAAGSQALFSNTTGRQNSAFGRSALHANTTGWNNSAFGSYALRANVSGRENAAFGRAALRSNIGGYGNTAVGETALFSNTSGWWNSAVGDAALQFNTAGIANSAVGVFALRYNTIGVANSAFGSMALFSNYTGTHNTAIGNQALISNNTGTYNTAVGLAALGANVSGHRNVAVGQLAGAHTTGSDNIYLVNQGLPDESGQIKIGMVGTHTQTTIAGISGATSADGIVVLVNASGELGTTTSSVRFKQDVRDMAGDSDLVMKLRPVSFRYREDAVGAEESATPQYGLIAEEVAEVAPELVAPDLEGKPYSVKYHLLPALLLNEVQEQEREISALRARLAQLESRLTGPEQPR